MRVERLTRAVAAGMVAISLTACGGGSGDDADDLVTPTPTVTATPLATESPAPEADATATTTPEPAPTTSPSANETPTAAPTPTPTATEPEPQGELVITEDDSGRTFGFTADTVAVLRLHPTFGVWSEPEVEGTSIELAERLFIRDPGYREWEIHVVGHGASVVRSVSDPCPGANPPCGAPSRLFEVTIDVA